MQTTSDRQLRVFLSSTFSDMQQERDALVKLFRELATEGQRRGVDIKLVDLRWGVTDDQRRTGRVISTCLREIDNSRPFFIGLVGDRYGWVPTSEELRINPELRERFPVVDEYCRQGLSMTEIEMRYGVLDSDAKDDSLFLIKRDVRYENDRHRRLSEELTSGKVAHEYYGSVEELTEKTREAIMRVLDRNFPLLSDIPEWQQYEDIHANIARAHRSGYIPYGNYLHRLDEWLHSDSQHLVVCGESGSGKSSLISEWLGDGNFSGFKVMYHFIGSGLAEGSYLELQRHFLTRLEHEYGLAPSSEKALYSEEDDYQLELEDALKEADRRGDRWLLVLDGLDHVRQNAITKLMVWFPELPPSAKAVYSTIVGDMTYNRLCGALGYEELSIPLLNKRFIEEIVRSYLANVGKSLDSNLVDMISSNSLFSNPQLLRLLLDELVTYGIHEQIGANVFNYSTSKDILEFYGKLIARAEEYYGAQLVKDILTLIACTKEGLSETAVMEILGIAPIEWAMAYSGLQRMFTFINGKYIITNPSIHNALTLYYNYEENDYQLLIDYKLRIVAYLEQRNEDIDEMVYLYWCCGNLERLHSILLNPDHLLTLLQHNDKFFAMYWTTLIEETDHSLYEYLDVEFKDLPNWDAHDQIDFLSYILTLQFADNELSLRLKERSTRLLLESGKNDSDTLYQIGADYLSMAQHLLNLGQIKESENMLKKAEQTYVRLGDSDNSEIYLLKSSMAFTVGDYEKSLEMALKAVETSEANNETVMWKYFNNVGLAYQRLNLQAEAINSFERALEEIKKVLVEETIEGATVMQNLGLSYYNTGQLDKAEELYKRTLDLYAANIENPGINIALLFNNQGLIYRDRDELDEAMDCFKEAAEILNGIAEATVYHGLIYKNIALIYSKKEDFKEEAEWLRKSVDAYWNLVDIEHPEFQNSCFALINSYEVLERFEELEVFIHTLLKRAEEESDMINQMVAYCHLRLGDAYLLTARRKFLGGGYRRKARKEYQAARDIFTLLGDEEGRDIAEESLSEI